MDRKVAVTGLGVVSPLGCDVASFWNNLVAGVCGIETITKFPTDELAAKVGGFVKDFDPEAQGIDKPFIRKYDPFAAYALAAANQAVKHSGIVSGENIDANRLGVYISSGVGGFTTFVNECTKMNNEGPRWVSPGFVSNLISNIGGAHVAIRHHACGPCVDPVSACAGATNAIGEAYRAIKHGYADAIIAGGAEATMVPLCVAAFSASRALTKSENPNYASLPFSADRGGFVLGEGAGVIVLEEYEHAKERGAEILAILSGYGNTCDAYHVTAPNPDGTTQAEAIRQALDEACYTSADVLHINAHGTGTTLNDSTETKAFKIALGEDAYKAHICSTKSMTGHLLGAAGGIEAIAAILALRDGIVPPTINLTNQDPELDLDFTPNKARKADLTIALSDSLGFGGHNACLAFRKDK